MAATQTAQQDMIAKQLAQQAMETIFTARETAEHRLGPDSERGRSWIARAFSVTGLQPIKQPGTDGIYGTHQRRRQLRHRP